ncbi:MAG: sugar phosphate isomerase/epimerase [Chloroflexi bacterium]|jgi:sugar phosphate isomerase/epimerase|nr:sugar phosphate isomerase/epimerase [Chloroflexota bacterium]
MKRSQISAALASLAGYTLDDALETMRQLGFENVGLLAAAGSRNAVGVLPGFFWNECSMEERSTLRDKRRTFGRVAVHAPFADLPLLSYCAEVRRLSQLMVQSAIEGAAFLEAESVTIHLETAQFQSLETGWAGLVEVGQGVGKYAALFGLKVGVETGFPPDPDDFVRLIQAIDRPNVGATLDLGHSAVANTRHLAGTPEGVTQANENVLRTIYGLGDKLFHVHLHDVRYEDWRDHREPGTGILDIPRIIAALDEIGYTRLLELELEEEQREDALYSSRVHLEGLATDGGDTSEDKPSSTP